MLQTSTGVRGSITRGLGEKQKNERIVTNYRIIEALYVKPYTYQQLWRATKIQRNTLKLRLDQLVNDDKIVLKHHYAFPNYRGKYTSRDFYLLNWAKRQSREMADRVFGSQMLDGPVRVMDPSSAPKPITSYEINSTHVEPSKRQYVNVIVGQDNMIRVSNNSFSCFLSNQGFLGRIRELCRNERDVFKQIRNCIDTTWPAESKTRHELIDERDSILETLVLLCTRFCVQKYGHIPDFCFRDLLVFFATIRLYDYWRPYLKFWKIMERVGY
jgi:hypothetical protein